MNTKLVPLGKARMSATTERFIAAFQSHGPLWRFQDENTIEAKAVLQLLEMLRWVVKAQKKAVGPRGLIGCDMIDNPNFNALAATYEQHEFVTLFSGAVDYIYLTYFALLSDPTTLASIGEASRESISQEFLDLLRTGHSTYTPAQLPKDPQRIQAARDLSLYTCLFILLHEVGHVVRGHPAFFQRKYGLSIHEEIPVSSASGKSSDLRLAFEWEADEYAAVTSYQCIRTLLQKPALFPSISCLDADLVWSISVSMTFCLIGHFSGGLDASSPAHPRPRFRYVWSMLSVESAPECKIFSPQTPALQNGFDEVAGWFVRHRFDFTRQKSTMLNDNADKVLEAFHKEYLAIRAALRAESALLDEIANERRVLAEAWRDSHSDEMSAIAEEAN